MNKLLDDLEKQKPDLDLKNLQEESELTIEGPAKAPEYNESPENLLDLDVGSFAVKSVIQKASQISVPDCS